MIQQTIIEGLSTLPGRKGGGGLAVGLRNWSTPQWVPGFSCYSLYIPEWGWRALHFWTANRNRWEKEAEKEKRDRDTVGETKEWEWEEEKKGMSAFPLGKGKLSWDLAVLQSAHTALLAELWWASPSSISLLPAVVGPRGP